MRLERITDEQLAGLVIEAERWHGKYWQSALHELQALRACGATPLREAAERHHPSDCDITLGGVSGFCPQCDPTVPRVALATAPAPGREELEERIRVVAQAHHSFMCEMRDEDEERLRKYRDGLITELLDAVCGKEPGA